MISNRIKSIQLRNFRSYRFLNLNANADYIIFIGENGAGKTNILEGLSLLSSTKGLRKASMQELKNMNSFGEWRVEVELEYEGYETGLATYSNNGKRLGTIDETSIKSLSEFEKLLWFLWITPQMNDIMIGQTQTKRSFFDHLVSGIDPHHHFRLQYLKKLQKERLHILANNYNKNWLDAIESKMAELFIKISEKRSEFLSILEKTLSDGNTNFLRPNIQCVGDVEKILLKTNEENGIIQILDALLASRLKDLELGITNFSVTRSSWLVSKNNDLSVENCSSGEQKAILISLILAAVKIYKKLRSGMPILLLDDIMVHLDENKRSVLIDELKKLKTQIFLTGTDDYFFKDFNENSKKIIVKNSICLS